MAPPRSKKKRLATIQSAEATRTEDINSYNQSSGTNMNEFKKKMREVERAKLSKGKIIKVEEQQLQAQDFSRNRIERKLAQKRNQIKAVQKNIEKNGGNFSIECRKYTQIQNRLQATGQKIMEVTQKFEQTKGETAHWKQSNNQLNRFSKRHQSNIDICERFPQRFATLNDEVASAMCSTNLYHGQIDDEKMKTLWHRNDNRKTLKLSKQTEAEKIKMKTKLSASKSQVEFLKAQTNSAPLNQPYVFNNPQMNVNDFLYMTGPPIFPTQSSLFHSPPTAQPTPSPWFPPTFF